MSSPKADTAPREETSLGLEIINYESMHKAITIDVSLLSYYVFLQNFVLSITIEEFKMILFYPIRLPCYA